MEMKILMSQTQLKRAHILRNYNEGVISRKTAAESLEMSVRLVTRLSKGVKEEGEKALIHKNTGRKPIHALNPEIKIEVLEIRHRKVYDGCNVSHFKDLLEREHAIRISYNALYTLLKENGIQSPKKHKHTVKHRRRKRKGLAGELIQIDATPYDWFRNGEILALHGGIDDATGQITGLYLSQNECLQGYFEITEQTCLNFGIPLSMYSDKHTIFRSPITDKKKEAGEEANHTQFGRALAELGINIIHANSPQAKGRIERLWETLQSRLPVEFSIKGITTIEAANEFLRDVFIPIFNERFAVPVEDSLNP